MSELFNLDDVFGEMENETKLSSVVRYLKRGEEVLLAMLPPMEYEGKPKLAIPIQGEYEGKPTTQFVLRFIVLHKVDRNVDWSKSSYVAIPLAQSLIAQIVDARKKDYALGEQTCNLLVVTKPQKTNIVFTPKTVTIPNDVWQGGETLTWAVILEALESMKENMSKKASKDAAAKDTLTEATPWS